MNFKALVRKTAMKYSVVEALAVKAELLHIDDRGKVTPGVEGKGLLNTRLTVTKGCERIVVRRLLRALTIEDIKESPRMVRRMCKLLHVDHATDKEIKTMELNELLTKYQVEVQNVSK